MHSWCKSDDEGILTAIPQGYPDTGGLAVMWAGLLACWPGMTLTLTQLCNFDDSRLHSCFRNRACSIFSAVIFVCYILQDELTA